MAGSSEESLFGERLQYQVCFGAFVSDAWNAAISCGGLNKFRTDTHVEFARSLDERKEWTVDIIVFSWNGKDDTLDPLRSVTMLS